MRKILHSIVFTIALLVTSISLKATTYYLRTNAVQPNLVTAWTTLAAGTSSVGQPANFNGSHTWVIVNRTGVVLSGVWNLPTTSTVNVGNGVTAITFSVTTAFGEIKNAQINVNANANLLIVNSGTVKTYNFGSLDIASTVTYSSATQPIVSTLYGNLTIGVTTSLTATTTDVNGTLTINSGKKLHMKGNTLDINGNIAGTGVLVGDASAIVYFLTGVTGNAGTLLFDVGAELLNTLYIQYLNPNSYVTLGTDLTVNTNFYQGFGSLDLNGKTLTVTGDASFSPDASSGLIISNANSSLILSGSIGMVSGLPDLYMDASSNSLKRLIVNCPSALNFGNAINIMDSLDVTDATVTTSNNLTLKSTNSLKARVSEIKGTGSISGNINVETFIKGGFAGWTGIAPSGVSGLTVANWDGGSGSATGFAMTCNGCINDEYSSGGSYFVSIQSDPLGTGVYTDLTASSGLTPGLGYWAFIGSSLTSAIDITQTTSGSIVTGSVSSPATSFVSNPYPSPISADRLKATNPTMGAVYVWDGDAGAYVSYNAGVGSLPNGAISMGQAFYIDGVGVNFLESHKVARNTSANYLMKTNSTNNIGTVFQLQVNGTNSDVDRMYVRMHQNATPNYDTDLDAYKKFATPGYVGYPGAYSAYTTISSRLNNVDYSINSVPLATTNNLVLPILVKVMSTGSYTIAPVDITNLPPNACVTLRDKLLNINHDLRTGAYVCNINDSTTVPRFELTICADITTGINQIANTSANMFISQDINGAFVKANFETSTKVIISAYNMMGQQIMKDKEMEGKDLNIYLDLDVHNQIVVIKATSANQSITKKVFVN